MWKHLQDIAKGCIFTSSNNNKTKAMKKVTATVENVKVWSKLISKENPEWGFFTVRSLYSEGIYEVSRDGDRTLIYANELKFWNIIRK